VINFAVGAIRSTRPSHPVAGTSRGWSMYLPEPVSPSEAEVVWASIPNPSARRVARALSQAGRHVHHSTVARWRADGWRTVASGLHPLGAARQALDVAVTVLTGDPIAGAKAVAGKTVNREELEGLSDHELLNRAVRETCIISVLVNDQLVHLLPKLLAEKPMETAVLIKALADTLNAIGYAGACEEGCRSVLPACGSG
jgi:hypothetical protein